jgi:hypothetical protein
MKGSSDVVYSIGGHHSSKSQAGQGHGDALPFMDEKLDSRGFLSDAFGVGTEPFLPFTATEADAPLVRILPKAATPWRDEPMSLLFQQFIAELAGRTYTYGDRYPLSYVALPPAQLACPLLAHTIRKPNPLLRILTFPATLERRRLSSLTGVVAGDESCLFIFPE